ncbi:2Fe-2S iron-sulfur cluster binding domain-containing protein [Ramlibacter sp. WS9]|uniref:2Fe-2S iron-sulfur cluster-binding protein n=1 Tax=Ramlibacter sp. WS9 TaxID=1882741 RepID=UPI001144B014|nr:2Fe-2S iron-sulfur cluster binding domain-containing protein [Ramlibacter sp. WS9]ROZ78062.1 oxidoreductase FAD-binding subunit [Ramlibacter sp. WS9]
MMNSAHEGPGARVRVEPDGRSFACAPGQTLLAAALAAGIDLPYECASGSCGTCRGQLAAGEVGSLWPDAPGLSERDRRKGDRILCCQSIPQGDCVIKLRAGDERVHTPPAPLGATVRSVRTLNPDVIHLVLEAQQPVDFLPGQFMLFALGAGIGRRAYSMANVAQGTGQLEFLIKRKPGGAASRFFFEQIKPGDWLDLEGPYGRAWLRHESQRDVVLLAGGSGLAPIWSIAQGALARSPQGPLRLYFGVNRAQDLFWLAEMEQAQQRHSNLQIDLVLMNPAPGDPVVCRAGTAGSALAADIDDLQSCDLYMAGPPGLIDNAMRELVATGRARADRVFYDRFC